MDEISENKDFKKREKTNKKEVKIKDTKSSNGNRINNYIDKCKKEINKKEINKKEINKENENFVILTEANFPEFGSKTTSIACVLNSDSFLEKIKNGLLEVNTSQIDLDFEKLEHGWLLIKKDITSNKIIKKYKFDNKIHLKENEELHILNSLTKLYETRKKNLIDLWGYEEWVKMYTYPNYDYCYFDKLDELCNDEYDENNSCDEFVDENYNEYE
jgi:hypothetical protein